MVNSLYSTVVGVVSNANWSLRTIGGDTGGCLGVTIFDLLAGDPRVGPKLPSFSDKTVVCCSGSSCPVEDTKSGPTLECLISLPTCGGLILET